MVSLHNYGEGITRTFPTNIYFIEKIAIMVGPQPSFFFVFCNNFPQLVILFYFSKMQRFSGLLAFSDCEIFQRDFFFS